MSVCIIPASSLGLLASQSGFWLSLLMAHNLCRPLSNMVRASRVNNESLAWRHLSVSQAILSLEPIRLCTTRASICTLGLAPNIFEGKKRCRDRGRKRGGKGRGQKGKKDSFKKRSGIARWKRVLALSWEHSAPSFFFEWRGPMAQFLVKISLKL